MHAKVHNYLNFFNFAYIGIVSDFCFYEYSPSQNHANSPQQSITGCGKSDRHCQTRAQVHTHTFCASVMSPDLDRIRSIFRISRTPKCPNAASRSINKSVSASLTVLRKRAKKRRGRALGHTRKRRKHLIIY